MFTILIESPKIFLIMIQSAILCINKPILLAKYLIRIKIFLSYSITTICITKSNF